MRRIAGLILLVWALGIGGGSVAVILGRVGEPSVPWRRVFMAMGGAFSLAASIVFVLGALGLMLDRERLKLFTAFTGLSGVAFMAGCVVASAVVSGTPRWAFPVAGVVVGAASLAALRATLFRRATWRPASAAAPPPGDAASRS